MKISSIFFGLTIIFIFCFFTTQRQINYWPLLKGKWCFSYEYSKEHITVFHRIGSQSMYLNFISKDSCLMPLRHGDENGLPYRKFNWKPQNDTLLLITTKKMDTSRWKILFINNEKLELKPILKISK